MWIKDWFSDRQQCVVLNGEAFDRIKVISGVPLESAIGSTLFILHVSCLERDLLSEVAKFSDNASLSGKALFAKKTEVKIRRTQIN